jgi:Flp pilus assembly protein TadB
MESTRDERLTGREVATDLKASVAARRELGDELEDHVLESFLARVQQRIDLQVREQVQQQLARSADQPRALREGSGRTHGAPSPLVVPAALGIAIPLVAIAGSIARGFGVLVVMVGVLAVLALYFEYSKR